MTALRTEDNAPRGFVPRAELYLALARIDELEAECDYLRSLIGLNNQRFLEIRQKLCVTPKEAQILSCMFVQRALSKAFLMEYIYGGKDSPEIKIIDVFICKLRRAIRERGGPPHAIETIWGNGYRLSPEGRAWLESFIPSLVTADPQNPASGHPSAITGASK